MSVISQQYTAVTGDTLTAARWNTEFQSIINDYNGSVTNANISGSAGIALSKLATTPATLTGSETLTNKTLTSPIINTPLTKGAYEAWVTDTDAATITFDLSTGNKHRVTLTNNRTLAVSNVQNGHAFVVTLIQDGPGSHTVTWFSGISWSDGGTVPTLTTTGGKADTFGFLQTGSNTYYGFTIGLNI